MLFTPIVQLPGIALLLLAFLFGPVSAPLQFHARTITFFLQMLFTPIVQLPGIALLLLAFLACLVLYHQVRWGVSFVLWGRMPVESSE